MPPPLPTPIRGVIFDLDGTLADTLPVCFAAFREVFREYLDTEHTDQEIRAMFGPSEEGVLQRSLGDRWQPALDSYLEHYDRLHAPCDSPFEGVSELLATLRTQSIRLAVVTGKGPRSAAISLRRTGLAGVFEHVEAGSPSGGVKAECMQRVLAAWSLPPEQVLSIGDATADIRSAKAAGLHPVAAAWAGTADASELAALSPLALFDSVAALRAWLNA